MWMIVLVVLGLLLFVLFNKRQLDVSGLRRSDSQPPPDPPEAG